MTDASDPQMDPTAGAQPTTDAGSSPDNEPARNAEDAGPRRREVSGVSPGSDGGAPSRDQMSIAFTPSQLAIGGAVVAGLVVVGIRILFGRRRGRD